MTNLDSLLKRRRYSNLVDDFAIGATGNYKTINDILKPQAVGTTTTTSTTRAGAPAVEIPAGTIITGTIVELAPNGGINGLKITTPDARVITIPSNNLMKVADDTLSGLPTGYVAYYNPAMVNNNTTNTTAQNNNTTTQQPDETKPPVTTNEEGGEKPFLGLKPCCKQVIMVGIITAIVASGIFYIIKHYKK